MLALAATTLALSSKPFDHAVLHPASSSAGDVPSSSTVVLRADPPRTKLAAAHNQTHADPGGSGQWHGASDPGAWQGRGKDSPGQWQNYTNGLPGEYDDKGLNQSQWHGGPDPGNKGQYHGRGSEGREASPPEDAGGHPNLRKHPDEELCPGHPNILRSSEKCKPEPVSNTWIVGGANQHNEGQASGQEEENSTDSRMWVARASKHNTPACSTFLSKHCGIDNCEEANGHGACIKPRHGTCAAACEKAYGKQGTYVHGLEPCGFNGCVQNLVLS